MTPESHTHTFEAAASAVASKVTYGGAGYTIFGWLTSNEFAIVAGVAVGVAGLVVNWYYKAKEDRRAAARHAAWERSQK